MVPPGHGVAEQGTLVAEDDLAPVDDPFVHHCRAAQRAPGDEHGNAADGVDDHLTPVEEAHRVRAGVPVDLEADDRRAVPPRRVLCCDKRGVVDREDGVAIEELTEVRRRSLAGTHGVVHVIWIGEHPQSVGDLRAGGVSPGAEEHHRCYHEGRYDGEQHPGESADHRASTSLVDMRRTTWTLQPGANLCRPADREPGTGLCPLRLH